MKCQIPQISWHGRDPVLSIDFQPNQKDLHRLASGGTDSHVVIWYVTYQENKAVKVECAADLYRHNKSVNVVRFSPNGELLASGDDEGALYVWQLKEREQADLLKDEENQNKENWYPIKTLRGHLEDIYDISWSPDGNYMVSASMDNSAIIWDMQKYQKQHILTDYKGYVQGVSWDPLNQYISSIGTDRALRIHSINSKKILHRIQKAPWTVTTEKGTIKGRLFYDDTLKSYFRRLTFTPDGELVIVPSGIREKEDKFYNTSYVFSRHSFSKPVMHLPTGDKYTVAVRCNPHLYKLRICAEDQDKVLAKPIIELPYRMIFAVAASDSILMYDTQQLMPFAYVSNIHYTHLTDLTWSPDGLTLVASSTDGYCSFVVFTEEELGEIYVPETAPVKDNPVAEEKLQVGSDLNEENILCKMQTSKLDGVNMQDKVVLESINVPLSVDRTKSVSPKIFKESVETISPKPLKDDCAKVSPRNVKSADKKAGKKPQKMCSIKSFFISPKAKCLMENPAISSESTIAPNNTEASVSLPQKHSVESGKKCGNSEQTSISKVSTPKPQTQIEKNFEVSSSNIKSDKAFSDVKPLLNNTKFVSSEKNEESCSIEIVFQGERTSPKTPQKPKCKVQLSFEDKFEKSKPKDNIPDLYSSNAMPLHASKVQNPVGECGNIENDWKLELSQDESSITPMEVETAEVTDTSPMEVEVATESKTLESKTVGNSPSLSNKTEKRRIPFVTLSTKVSSHPGNI